MSRGRVFADGKVGDKTVWAYEVRDSTGKVVVTDNACGWRRIFDYAFEDVNAVRRIERMGHRLEKSYEQLVDEAFA